MPAPYHGWLYVKDADGELREIINHSRLAAYMQNPVLALPGGVSICSVLDFGGCEAYAYQPPCDSDDAWLDFPGTSGNLITVPDAAALDIVGDLTLIADVAMDDWTPAAVRTVIGKWGAAGTRSYKLDVDTAGQLVLSWTTAGTTAITATSTANLSTLAAGERRALRADLDVVNGANRQITFWTAETNAGPWTQLGTTITTAGTTSVFSGAAPLTIGVNDTLFMTGKTYYAQVRTGMSGTASVGGTAVLTIDPNVIPTTEATVFQALTGQTVTISRSGSPDTEIGLGAAFWEPLSFSSPDVDPAPWYNSGYPESAGAYGFWVEEWTGLDSSHTARPISPSGSYRSQLGRIGSKERVMKINLLLLASSERSLEYLYRWIESSLTNVCATCETDSMYIRRFCPDPGVDPGEGVAELRKVGLVEGFKWESDPVDQGQCYLRRMSFTLAAGDPCMYLPATEIPFDSVNNSADVLTCLGDMNLSTDRIPCRPTCQELPETCRTLISFEVNPLGAAGPVLTLTNDTDEYAMPIRVICYADPLEIGIDPNPCGLPVLGEIYIGPMSPWSELVWDVAGRDVRYADHTTGEFTTGWAFIDGNDPPYPRFFALPCGVGHIVIEPASACLEVDSGDYIYFGVNLGSAPAFPTPSLEIVERIGCA